MLKIVQIKQSLKESQLQKNSERVNALRNALSKIQNLAIELKKPIEDLTDNEVETILIKLSKQREESIEAFKKGNREDLVAKEQKELEILKEYIPAQMTIEETKPIIIDLIQRLNIKDVRQMGRVLAEIKKGYNNKIDMRIASEIVKSILSQ